MKFPGPNIAKKAAEASTAAHRRWLEESGPLYREVEIVVAPKIDRSRLSLASLTMVDRARMGERVVVKLRQRPMLRAENATVAKPVHQTEAPRWERFEQ